MSDKKYIIEPLDTEKHDREAFSCDVTQVDNFLKKTANKLMSAGNTQVRILREEDNISEIIGFYALNAHAIHYTDLPKKYQRARPGHGNIPASFISMIGVDAKHQGQGHGSALLVDALERTAKVSYEMGVAMALLDVLDCGNQDIVERRKAMYEGYGFKALESDPLRMYLPVKDIIALIEE